MWTSVSRARKGLPGHGNSGRFSLTSTPTPLPPPPDLFHKLDQATLSPLARVGTLYQKVAVLHLSNPRRIPVSMALQCKINQYLGERFARHCNSLENVRNLGSQETGELASLRKISFLFWLYCVSSRDKRSHKIYIDPFLVITDFILCKVFKVFSVFEMLSSRLLALSNLASL